MRCRRRSLISSRIIIRCTAAAKRAVTGRKPGMSATGIDSSDDDSDGEDEDKVASAPISEVAAKKKAAALEVVPDNPSGEAKPLEILKAIDIKKMNGDSLKEALQARGLSTQGAKKDLIQRLTDHEKTRA